MRRQNCSEPRVHHGICGLHFASDCFEDQHTHLFKQVDFQQHRKLKVDAVPSILTKNAMVHSPAAAASTQQANTESLREKSIRYCK